MTALAPGLRDAAVLESWWAVQAPRAARLCHAMAERFARGGRLLAFGAGPVEATDVAHVEVEFVHPVIVGKRALPALATDAASVGLLAEADDVVLAFGAADGIRDGLARARARGSLTVAFAHAGADHEFPVPTDDPLVAQEQVETLYHVLWELVHVFFEHQGLLHGRTGVLRQDSGASSFLYPFLGEQEHDLDGVLRDVGASVLAKAHETAELRAATLRDNAEAIAAAAGTLRGHLADGGRVLAFGNGGSATDAADLVADLRLPPPGRGWAPRPAIDLSAAPAVLTAVANDVGVEAIFTRQLIAHGREDDVVVAISTSGGSANVLHALGRARHDGLATIALVGYDGGRILAEGLADHVIVSRSEHIPRIQEAQATVLHALRGLLEEPPG